MPKVKGFDEGDDGYAPREPGTSVLSVVFALMIMLALVVSAAAWMGGSMAKVENSFGNALDTMARTTGVAVETVAVLGLDDEPALRDTVKAAAMIEPGENMWRADPHRIKARIEGSGKVMNVTVHRLWPNQVVITAQPAEPAALWHDGVAWQVIDARGRVMTGARPDAHAELLKVSGAGADVAVVTLIDALQVAPSVTPRIQLAKHVASRRWDLLMDNGLVVRLPAADHLADALSRFERLNASRNLVDRPLAMADFRLERRVFLRPKTVLGEGAA